MHAVLENLYRVFGDVVLLPVPFKTKKPVLRAWNKITFSDTLKIEYQDDLEYCAACGGNIGVVLGPLSGGLIAIDLDADELVDPFLVLNPDFDATTRTVGRRGCQFFIRTTPGTPYPNSKALI